MEFMERFGLTSLDDLPPLEAEIAAQLAQAEEDARAESETTDAGTTQGEPADAAEASEQRASPAEATAEEAPAPDA
jgi:hypothetical protein